MSALDIGVSDVHIPSAGASMAKPTKLDRRRQRLAKADARAKERAKRKKPLAALQPVAGKSLRIRMTAPDGSHTTIHQRMSADSQPLPAGVPAYFNPANGQLLTFVPLNKAEALGDGDSEKLVWVNVARAGSWAGHPQGAFRLHSGIFDALERNFKASGVRRIQWDFNHCSAMPPSSGNIPVVGTPAQGWIYDMRNDGVNFSVLTEWKPLARQYIENDQYDSASVVIDWNGKDRVSGKPVGPILRSVALTNEAFITGLAPLAASTSGVESEQQFMPLTEVSPDSEQAHQSALSAKYGCHSFLGMLPRLKQVFGLHELSTAEHVATALENYRTHLDALEGDGMGSHEGVDLSGYSQSLREMTNAHAGMDWYAILDIIDELMDAYLEQHGLPDFEESHGPIPGTEASAVPPVATAASLDGVTMTKPDEPEAVVAPVETAAPAAVETPAPEVPQATVTAASATVDAALPDPALSTALLKIAELEAKLKQAEASTSALSVANQVAVEQALEAEVDAAIVTYKDSKGLTPELRPHLLSMLKATPDDFRAMYPAVDADKRHLLLNLTGGDGSNPAAPGARVEADTAAEVVPAAEPEQPEALRLSLIDLTKKLIADSGQTLTWGAAHIKADAMRRQALSQ